jgi:tRNA-splicing endonuclease subunit Sen34
MVRDDVGELFPIFHVAQRYLLFDINIISHIRREHHICGVLIGNIPQATQQTIFSGIPLELMPEEVRLLVETGHAFIVDDVTIHASLASLDATDKHGYLALLEQEGFEVAQAMEQQAIEKKKAFFKKSGASPRNLDSVSVEALQVTPTTSYPPLVASISHKVDKLPEVPQSYHIFKHLHEQGYFLGPGLRFGCQYVAYPGDPLRYHSHFLVTGQDWDEDIDLLDIVGGGRLGTGVKKGYMIGGATQHGEGDNAEEVRTFSFEWAAM